ncbi:MAG TPA: hypothetical protein VGS19_11810 [Streptosporangiaceae bacterium]|nr:hypothetical protein [Streptosporangiaceae bacterium]
MANNPRTCPSPKLEEISTHLTALAGMNFCPQCGPAVTAVVSDVAALLSILAVLCDELARIRLENVDLRAAMRAALGAAADGGDNPLDYLRWELPELSPGWPV